MAGVKVEQQMTSMKQTNHIKAAGEITSAMGYENFRVRLDNGIEILATPNGKMRLHHIRLTPGDKVEIELSPYDMTRGRITFRH
jgi:translation initiation factor IF-1